MPIVYRNSVQIYKVFNKKRRGLHVEILDFTEVTSNHGLERGNGYVYQGCVYSCSYKEEQDIQVSVKDFTKQ